MKSRAGSISLLLLVLLIGASCEVPGAQPESTESVRPARVETTDVGEESLALVRLTSRARERLGITTDEVRIAPAVSFYTVAGEMVLPPGQTLLIAAPLAGTVVFPSIDPLVGNQLEAGKQLAEIRPLLSVPRDLRTNAEADVSAARTRLETARLRAQRAEKMLQDRVGSERALEETVEAVRLAETGLAAAESRLEQIETSPMDSDVSVKVTTPQGGVLRQIYVGSGQAVSAGDPLFEIVRIDPLWVRVPVYSGDLEELQPGANALVRPIGANPGTREWKAHPVVAPPTADPVTSTTDLYFVLSNQNRAHHPGERVGVSVPRRGKKECLQVPYSSILFDMQGGTWVYEEVESLAYTRRRVLVDYVFDQIACLEQGPEEGTAVVVCGGPELFGEEFGVGH